MNSNPGMSIVDDPPGELRRARRPAGTPQSRVRRQIGQARAAVGGRDTHAGPHPPGHEDARDGRIRNSRRPAPALGYPRHPGDLGHRARRRPARGAWLAARCHRRDHGADSPAIVPGPVLTKLENQRTRFAPHPKPRFHKVRCNCFVENGNCPSTVAAPANTLLHDIRSWPQLARSGGMPRRNRAFPCETGLNRTSCYRISPVSRTMCGRTDLPYPSHAISHETCHS